MCRFNGQKKATCKTLGMFPGYRFRFLLLGFRFCCCCWYPIPFLCFLSLFPRFTPPEGCYVVPVSCRCIPFRIPVHVFRSRVPVSAFRSRVPVPFKTFYKSLSWLLMIYYYSTNRAIIVQNSKIIFSLENKRDRDYPNCRLKIAGALE